MQARVASEITMRQLGREMLSSQPVSHRQAPLDGATQRLVTCVMDFWDATLEAVSKLNSAKMRNQ